MTAVDEAELERLRHATFVRQIDCHASLSSTNDEALRRVAVGDLEPPHLILAYRQTAGRGRGANRWWAAPGALTFSLVLEMGAHNLPAARWPQVSLTTGLAVCQALRALLPEFRFGLKWPNDVFLDDRKICGVLIEAPPQPPGYLVLGIGVNVNNSFADAPPELQTIAASLLDAVGRPLSIVDVLERILTELHVLLGQLAQDDLSLPRRWRELCILQGRPLRIRHDTETWTGVCQGIADDGALRLLTADGERAVYSGVVGLE